MSLLSMLRQYFALVAVTLLLSSGAQAQASSGQHPSSSEDPNNLVRLLFVVAGHHGKPVKDLGQEQFTILDNNQPPDRVVSFEGPTTSPLRVGLVIDASRSMTDAMPAVKKLSRAFLQEIIRPSSDKALVLAFNHEFSLPSDFTDDQSKLAADINEIRAWGGTALFDSVYHVCRDKLMREGASAALRAVIVLVSDGEDNQSHVKRDEAIQMAQRAGVVIYAINPGSNVTSNDSGDGTLRRLAEETGGQAFFRGAGKGMQSSFAAIADELRSQYLITYVPHDLQHNGEFRTIKMGLKDKNLKIHARKGYLAPRD